MRGYIARAGRHGIGRERSKLSRRFVRWAFEHEELANKEPARVRNRRGNDPGRPHTSGARATSVVELLRVMGLELGQRRVALLITVGHGGYCEHNKNSAS